MQRGTWIDSKGATKKVCVETSQDRSLTPMCLSALPSLSRAGSEFPRYKSQMTKRKSHERAMRMMTYHYHTVGISSQIKTISLDKE